MQKKDYRGYFFTKHKPGGWDIFAGSEVTATESSQSESAKAFCGWSPDLDIAKKLVDAFISGDITPWYESEASESVLGEPEESSSYESKED